MMPRYSLALLAILVANIAPANPCKRLALSLNRQRLQRELSEIVTKLRNLPESELANAEASYQRQSLSGNEFAIEFISAVNASRLARIPRGERVALAVGTNAPANIGETIAAAREKGLVIVYDADSKMASMIAQKAGPNGVGITARPIASVRLGDSGGRIISITNPYLRMEAFGRKSNQAVLATSDSLLGVALTIEGHATHGAADLRGFSGWVASRNGDLGLKVPEALQSEGTFLNALRDNPGYGKGAVANLTSQLSRTEVLRSVDIAAEIYGARLSYRGEDLPMGAAVLGSSSRDPRFVPLVEGVGQELGKDRIPAYTGGAGGYMDVTNTAAKNAGGPSIGVPVAQGSAERLRDPRLAAEKEVPRGSHTLTLTVSGYPSRIPVIMENRSMFVFVPGGNGTMRELAVGLLLLNSQSPTGRRLFFAGNDYYSGLVTWLKNLPLGNELAPRLRLIDSKTDFRREIDALRQELGARAATDLGIPPPQTQAASPAAVSPESAKPAPPAERPRIFRPADDFID